MTETKKEPEPVDITGWCFAIRAVHPLLGVAPVFIEIFDAPGELHLPVARSPEELAAIYVLARVECVLKLQLITDAEEFVSSLPENVHVVYDVRVENGKTLYRQVRMLWN